MRIGILSSDSKLYSTRRLKEVAQQRGHSVRVIHPATCSLFVEENTPALFVKDKPVPKYDAVIPRVSSSQNVVGSAVVRQFEQMGVFSLNSSYAINIAHDKLRTMQILSRHQIGIPPSSYVFSRANTPAAIERVGGAPVVVKLLFGSQGSGVMLAESNKVAEAIIEALRAANHSVLIQKFISESKGRDIRAFVVGDRVVASMRRTAEEGEFRSNIHRGGAGEKVQLSADYEKAAIRAAHIIGLRVAGVDILESDQGPKIVEVNSSPGLEGIETTTGVDVASAVIEYLESEVQFPDIDLRERLSLSRGYSITEIIVARQSPLANKTLKELALEHDEVQVLSITRNGLPIPMPRAEEMLLPGDLLLCFGKQLTLKALQPPAKTRKSK